MKCFVDGPVGLSSLSSFLFFLYFKFYIFFLGVVFGLECCGVGRGGCLHAWVGRWVYMSYESFICQSQRGTCAVLKYMEV